MNKKTNKPEYVNPEGKVFFHYTTVNKVRVVFIISLN